MSLEVIQELLTEYDKSNHVGQGNEKVTSLGMMRCLVCGTLVHRTSTHS
jgi:hypothetical protein